MNISQLRQKSEEFKHKNVLVIGDVMIDAYFHGAVDRISPEAPVPVVQVTKKEYKSGGAANVALNINALGANSFICGVIGADEDGQQLLELLENQNVDCSCLATTEDRKTTVKTRILSNGHQILRVDHEETKPIDEVTEQLLLSQIRNIIDNVDLIILEDYNKGVLTKKFISDILDFSKTKNIPVAVDPKKENFFEFKGVSLFKPNRKEIIEGLKLDNDLKSQKQIKAAMNQLQEKIGAETVMVTLSEDGMVIAEKEDVSFFPAHKRNIYDVSGAGDTVISVAGLCMISGIGKKEAAWISNVAGGMVCEKPGVVQVNLTELLEEVDKLLEI